MMSRRGSPANFAALAVIGALMTSAAAVSVSAKDIGPANPECDRFAKTTSAWTACAGTSAALGKSGDHGAASDASLFYAGYWLAKTGRYDEALTYLNAIRLKNEKALTYIGFAIRKTGNPAGALRFYSEALAKNPDYVVARAYLGDAYLTLGKLELAKAELAQIERRCGRACEAHAELAAHIAAFERVAKS